MSRFAEMRTRSAAGNSAEQLAKQMAAGEKYEADTRYWTLSTDAAGNGSAVIRFLPSPVGEEDAAPYVKIWSHGFKGPTGQWYIEPSLTTLGKPDPVSEHNQKLWATETKENQALVRQRKRGLRYISNVYVIKDPANPANEGKVFLYSYGQKIMDKVVASVTPEFEDQTPVDPFDMWAGANFRLRVKKIDGGNGRKFPNYDSSEFAPASALLDDDAALEQLWNQEYSLKEEVSPSNPKFKSYDDLKKRFYQVICEDADDVAAGTGRAAQKRNEVVDDGDDERTSAPAERKSTASFSQAAASAPAEEDEDMAWFKGLEQELDS